MAVKPASSDPRVDPCVGPTPFVYTMTADELPNLSSARLIHLITAHKILIIRQPTPRMSASDFSTLMKQLGDPLLHPLQRFSLTDHPEILKLSNYYQDKRPIGVHEGGTYWHTDLSYRCRHSVFTALYSLKCPTSRGVSATEFVDCESAYSTIAETLDQEDGILSQLLRSNLNALVTHQFGNRATRQDPDAASQRLMPSEHQLLDPDVEHSLVSKHPLTGRLAFYGVAATSTRIGNLDEATSITLLNWLLARILSVAPRYVHHYRIGDIIIWDNLSTLHRGIPTEATADPNECRLLYRMNVAYA